MEEENGLSFGEILKVIFRKVWWVVGAVAAGILVLVLVSQLWYNKNNQFYSVEYEVVFPDVSDGKYPDGSALLAADSISYRTLTSIVNGEYSDDGKKDEFKNIDVEKMVTADGINITEQLTQQVSGGVKREYTVTVMAKYFKDGAQAADFLRKVAQYPVNRAKSVIADKEYGIYFPVYENAQTYEEKIAALLSQKQYIESNYNSISISDTSVTVNLALLNTVFTSTQRQSLNDTIVAKGYVYDTASYKADADTRMAALEKQISDNANVIEKLQAERSSVSNSPSQSDGLDVIVNAYDSEIAKLIVKNGELSNELLTIADKLVKIEAYTDPENAAYAEKQEFDAQLEQYKVQLTEATETLKSVTEGVYQKNSNVIFGSNVIAKQGGLSTIVAALLGAVIGLLASAIVICIVDLPKYKREKLAKANGDGQTKIEEEEEKKDEN